MKALTVALQIVVGLQYVFWGLNGFLHFKALPPSDERIQKFVERCYQTPGLMNGVKIIQILAGLLLILDTQVLAALLFLFPITTVISWLHLRYNKRKAEVLVPLSLPFYILTTLLICNL